MSSESFKAFMAKVTQEPELRQKLRAAGGDAGLSVEALSAFASGMGYAFTAEDVTGELSEKQLEGVAGGLARGLARMNTYDWHKLTGVSSYQAPSGGDLMFKFF